MIKREDIKNILVGKSLIIFDFDGTIADTTSIHKKAFTKILSEYNLRFDYNMIAGKNTKDAIKYLFRNNKYNIEDSEISKLTELKQKLARKLIREGDNLKILPGVAEFLDWSSRNYKLVVASSGSKGTVLTSLEILGLSNMFSKVYCSEDVKNSKPAPDIFLKAIAEASVNTLDAIVFEDSDAGINAAKSAEVEYIDVRDNPFNYINQLIRGL